MLYFGLGVYTLFLVIIWGFFVIAKIHAYKFKNLGDKIEPITKILLVILAILSISGYILLFYILQTNNSVSLPRGTPSNYFNEINY